MGTNFDLPLGNPAHIVGPAAFTLYFTKKRIELGETKLAPGSNHIEWNRYR